MLLVLRLYKPQPASQVLLWSACCMPSLPATCSDLHLLTSPWCSKLTITTLILPWSVHTTSATRTLSGTSDLHGLLRYISNLIGRVQLISRGRILLFYRMHGLYWSQTYAPKWRNISTSCQQWHNQTGSRYAILVCCAEPTT